MNNQAIKGENPLNISEVIALLKKIKQQYGDINVGTWSNGILKYIRSIDCITGSIPISDEKLHAAVLQWWYEPEGEQNTTRYIQVEHEKVVSI